MRDIERVDITVVAPGGHGEGRRQIGNGGVRVRAAVGISVGEILQLAETDDIAARLTELRHQLGALIVQLRYGKGAATSQRREEVEHVRVHNPEASARRCCLSRRIGPRIRRVRKRDGRQRVNAIGAKAIVEDADEESARYRSDSPARPREACLHRSVRDPGTAQPSHR